MTTKIVYVLVSSPKDIYLEQAQLSIFTLRQHTPKAYVIVVVDDVTYKSLFGSRSKIKKLVDEFVVVERDTALTAKESAYFYKTTLRDKIKGDFMFIDTDTIVVDDISGIDDCPYEVAAVPDAHVRFDQHFDFIGLKKYFQRLNFEINDNYYNSGVLYVKDTKQTQLLFQKWTQNWKQLHNKCIFDQPLLAKANSEMDVISELPGEWNCQISYGVKFLKKAKIIHYFASNFSGSKYDFPFLLMNNELFQDIKFEGKVSEEIKALLDDSFSMLNTKLEIVGGRNVDLLHSQQMKLLKLFYFQWPQFFRTIEYLLNHILNFIR